MVKCWACMDNGFVSMKDDKNGVEYEIFAACGCGAGKRFETFSRLTKDGMERLEKVNKREYGGQK